MVEPAIRFEDVTKRFDEVEALRGLDLSVAPGEIFGFLGPNGAGKTTAIRIMFDLIRPTAGHVWVLGHDAQRQGMAVRRLATHLPSDVAFYDSMTGDGYLDLIASIREAGVDPTWRSRLVERLQLDPSRRIGTLSRGNRQKVGLVAALMSRPALVVLDEPTSGLDPIMQETVEDILREVAAEGVTVFFSSHVLGEVEQLCSRVAMLRLGRVVRVIDLEHERLVAPRRVEVTFAEAPARTSVEGVPGAALTSLDGTQATFETQDGIDALVKRLAQFTVLRLDTHEASLEEMFLTYYGETEGVQA
jgi:ABC-2 type transport system ATP-binding protein